MTPPARRIKVLIVDDSTAVLRVLSGLLSADPGIEVVGTAINAEVARDKIARLSPDVLTLDIEMPGVDGLTFLDQLMKARPMPVIMVSSRTQAGAIQTIQSLELGAVDFLPKPTTDTLERLGELGDELIAKVRAAARARLQPRPPLKLPRANPRALRVATPSTRSRPIIAIGASTGGVNAIIDILAAMPLDGPGVLIVQHMPPAFTRTFAERCDELCKLRVREACEGDAVMRGLALIAPGGHHMRLTRGPAGYAIALGQEPRVNGSIPSIDVLFDSVARCAGDGAVGVLLTGVGEDGARGLLRMRQAGARTLAQNEATSTVFGMAQKAIALGAAGEVLPLGSIASKALLMAERRPPGSGPPHGP